jgi:hypothetical protein
MPRLYVANMTLQTHEFYFVTDERKKHIDGQPPPQRPWRCQSIRAGTQVCIASKELAQSVIDDIIEQHAKYGLVAASELDKTRGFHGLCYSIDKPVNFQDDDVGLSIEQNDNELNKSAQIKREVMAASIAENIERTMRERNVVVPHAEISVRTEKGDPNSQVAEGYEIANNGASPRRPDAKMSRFRGAA